MYTGKAGMKNPYFEWRQTDAERSLELSQVQPDRSDRILLIDIDDNIMNIYKISVGRTGVPTPSFRVDGRI